MWKLWRGGGAAAPPNEDFKLAPNCTSRKTRAEVQVGGQEPALPGTSPTPAPARSQLLPFLTEAIFREWEKAKTTRGDLILGETFLQTLQRV